MNLIKDLAFTPLDGEPCPDGIQIWMNQEHVYARLRELVLRARAMFHTCNICGELLEIGQLHAHVPLRIQLP